MRKVEVVPYDPSWPEQFREEAEAIRQACAGIVSLRLHHIGSTSVPGLAAKPILDLLGEAESLEGIDAAEERLAALGYEARGENGIPGRRFFQKGGDARSHHLHLFRCGDANVLRHLAFRDYLCACPEVVRAYGQLKKRLAERFPADIEKYIAGKQEFVKQTERKALQWIKDR
ncbi:MAG TPA: GrpB family protein [Bacillales bacterium]|nr:GrpB family protein [Bacillales bacterium]